MTDDISEKLHRLTLQIRREYHSPQGHLAALENAIAELLKIAEVSPDPDVAHLLAEAREQRAMIAQRTRVIITTPMAIGEWNYVIEQMESLIRQGITEFVDDAGEKRDTIETLMLARKNASEWSRRKAHEYMLRARDLLPVAPIAALNYLNKIREFPLLPNAIVRDVEDLVSAANELVKNQQGNSQNPIRFAAMIQLLNRKVDALNENQQASRLQIDQLRASVLERIAGVEIAMVQVVNSLDENALKSLNLVAQAIEEGKIAREECLTILDAIHRTLKGLRASNKPMPEVAKVIEGYVSETKVDATHRLKVIIPIIPFLLDYEGELDLGTDVNLRKLWEKIVGELKK